ncbi:MAG: 16S rRNA pseudouridine(516) synthase RsuA [Gammaproteobacteria bacterium]
MRLDKLVSHTTGITRKAAHKLIREGRVRVGGELVRDTATHVTPEAVVTLDGEPLGDGGPRYFMLHKPQGVISATYDGEHETVLNLLDEPRQDKLHIAGRLDIDTTGLVLITDDGQWSHRITHPGRGCRKVYRVEVTHPIDPSLVELFRQGVMLHGERDPTLPAELEILDTPGKNECLLVLQEGRHHQVKRMFASVDNRVTKLHRERIGDIQLDPALEPGEYRELTPEEIASVR